MRKLRKAVHTRGDVTLAFGNSGGAGSEQSWRAARRCQTDARVVVDRASARALFIPRGQLDDRAVNRISNDARYRGRR